MTEAFRKALSILQDKGSGITDSDVEEINHLSYFFDDDEIMEDQAFLYEVVEQIRMRPESKLSIDGGT
tara:strand:+ start:366 stop:569 length:204 start_codon:yes stop_codon:yes gene_type:complete